MQPFSSRVVQLLLFGAGEGEQVLHGLLAQQPLALDGLEVLVLLGVRVGLAQQELAEAEDDPQRVVDLVGDPGGKRPQAGQLLGVHQLALEVLGFGDVAGDAQDGPHFTRFGFDGHEVGADPDRLGLQRQFEFLADAFARAVYAGDERGETVGLRRGESVGNGFPDKNLRRAAEEIRGEGVQRLEAALPVHGENEILGTFHQRAVFLLRLGQGVGLGEDPRLQDLRPAVFQPDDGAGPQRHRQDHEPQEQK